MKDSFLGIIFHKLGSTVLRFPRMLRYAELGEMPGFTKRLCQDMQSSKFVLGRSMHWNAVTCIRRSYLKLW